MRELGGDKSAVPADESVDDFLEAVYFDPLHPGSYSGIVKLWEAVKLDNPHNLTFI